MAAALQILRPVNRQEWRDWLTENHHTRQMVWVVCAKKHAGTPAIARDVAVNEALCFGWIDSTTRPLDAQYYLQSFTKRKPKSVWSKINKAKVEWLIKEGWMTEAGYASIEAAKSNGYWTILDEVEALVIPKDLQKEFRRHPAAKAHFTALSRSEKKILLQKLVLAKKPETREKRIGEIVGIC